MSIAEPRDDGAPPRNRRLIGEIQKAYAFRDAHFGLFKAFCASLLTEDSVTFGVGRTVYFLIAVGFFTVSLFGGIIVTITRLQDARLTAKIVGKRHDQAAKAEI